MAASTSRRIRARVAQRIFAKALLPWGMAAEEAPAIAGDASGADTAIPHLLQNLTPPVSGLPQLAQNAICVSPKYAVQRLWTSRRRPGNCLVGSPEFDSHAYEGRTRFRTAAGSVKCATSKPYFVPRNQGRRPSN